MKCSWKTTTAIVAVLMAVVMAAPAMAFDLNARSEEMVEESLCDVAGTMKMSFNENDEEIILDWLNGTAAVTISYDADGTAGAGTAVVFNADDRLDPAFRASILTTGKWPGVAADGTITAGTVTIGGADLSGQAITSASYSAYFATSPHNYVLIRSTLSGTDVPSNISLPTLCKSIPHDISKRDISATTIPHNSLVIQLEDDYLSESNVVGTKDLTAYVWGQAGNQFFEIYITDWNGGLPLAGGGVNWSNAGTWPWLRVGQLEDNDDVAICVNVSNHNNSSKVGFSGNAKLIVSLDNTPQDLNYNTSDNQIGHFLEGVSLNRCDKDLECEGAKADTSVPLLAEDGQDVQVFTACFEIEGPFPDNDRVNFSISTNGNESGDDTQSGIYFSSISLLTETGATLQDIDNSDVGVTEYTTSNWVTPAKTGTFYQAEHATGGFVTPNGLDFIRVCIKYVVRKAEAEKHVGDNVKFWFNIETEPCGTVLDDMGEAGTIGRADACMYFPYVLVNAGDWQTGIAISNLDALSAADMEATFTLTDQTGASFSYTKTDFETTNWVSMMSGILEKFDGTPADGAAWLYIKSNFTMDGYSFLNGGGQFGAGTLPRVLTNCDAGRFKEFK